MSSLAYLSKIGLANILNNLITQGFLSKIRMKI